MHSYNHLNEIFLSEDNYYTAVKNACKGKGGKRGKRGNIKIIRNNPDIAKDYILRDTSHFKNDVHHPKYIYDGISRKRRLIYVPSLREQIVHHMVANVLKPIFMKNMYEHSYGSIPGRGVHKGKKQIEKWIKRGDRNMKYCLKMDIRKYFDSIPHDILKAKLAKLIHDEKFLAVLNEIVDATGTDKGIPIGFYTSQWFANWYLTELDHYIKEVLHVAYYIRYVDDMVIYGSNKKFLHRVRKAIATFLKERLGLEMKSNWQVFLFDYVKSDGTHVGRDLDFLGFRFFRDRTILRKNLMYKMCRKARRIKRKVHLTVHDCSQMLSYIGWLDCTDTHEMYLKQIKPYVNFGYLKSRISENNKNKEVCKNVARSRKCNTGSTKRGGYGIE